MPRRNLAPSRGICGRVSAQRTITYARRLSDSANPNPRLSEAEREMERAMRAFEEDGDQAKQHIEAEWRREHWGHEPERLPAWENH
jgi:hypothetical protein